MSVCVFVLYANVTLNVVRCVGFFYCSVALVFFSSHTTQPYHMVLCVCYRFGIVGAVRVYVKRILKKKQERNIHTKSGSFILFQFIHGIFCRTVRWNVDKTPNELYPAENSTK